MVYGGDAAAALQQAVRSYGEGALSDPVRLQNLLADLVPGESERQVLLRAAEFNVVARFRAYLTDQMDPDTAMRLTAEAFASFSRISLPESSWATQAYASALGYNASAPAPPPPSATWASQGSTVAPPGQPGWGAPGTPAPGTATAGSGFKFDFSRVGALDWAVAGATLVVLIGMFLPWYGISFADGVGGTVSATASGEQAHGWLWLSFILDLIIIGELVGVAGWATPPYKMPADRRQVLLGLTALNAVLVLIAFLSKPAGPVGWRWGGFLSLIAAIIAITPLVRPSWWESMLSKAKKS